MAGLAPPLSVRFLPVVERELRLAARGRGLYRWRTGVVTLGLGLMALVSATLSSAGAPASVQGRTLFQWLVGISTLYAVLAGVTVTADSVSREKREGTLGLLFLTDLRGMDIILGKLAASSLNTVYGLIGLLPLLAIPVMLGGVSPEAGVLATLGVVNLLFVSLSVGILVSTLSWDERRATFAAVVTMLALTLGPMFLGGFSMWFFGRGSVADFLLSALSPVLALTGMVPNVGPGRVWSPFLALVPSHLLGWALLLHAGRTVERAWQSRSGSPVKRTVDERVFTPRNAEGRALHRRRMLDVHPLVWLLERHPGKRFYADGLVVAIILIWAWGYTRFGTDMFGGPVWFLIVPLAFAIHLILASWVVSEASMRLLEDRRSGALELLLCTSMSDDEILQGHRLVLRRLFLRALLLLAATEVFIAFTGFGTDDDSASMNGRWLMLGMAFAVLSDTHALSWIALRLAMVLPTTNRVNAYALAITPLGPLVLVLVLWAGLTVVAPGVANQLGFVGMLLIWLGAVLMVNLVGAQWLGRMALRRDFRSAATGVRPGKGAAEIRP